MKDPIYFENDKLILLDQTKLPEEEIYIELDELTDVEEAIKRLSIRGAPNLGVAALYGTYISIMTFDGDYNSLKDELDKVCGRIAKTRPTAYDLFAALDIARDAYNQANNAEVAKNLILEEAHNLKIQLIERSKKIGKHGAELVPNNAGILTHCNTGALAAPGDGTAFSVIAEAARQNKVKMVYADETRPLLQGSRLTMWELQKRNIPCKVNTDNSAGYLMAQGLVNFIIVGADRIARNGDAANKIGTYSLAVLADYHNIPFYIAAPSNTFDKSIESGAEIEIEMRDRMEVVKFRACQNAPMDSYAMNPAFDVTPHKLITGIITENGIIDPNG